MFSDSTPQGVRMPAIGGQATIVIFCSEMVAKLKSNDYFASNILPRSTEDSFRGGKFPYTSAIEAWCSTIYKFGTAFAVNEETRFAGERTTDFQVDKKKFLNNASRCTN